MQLCAKFGNFWVNIHGEIICQIWQLFTIFFNFPIVHCVEMKELSDSKVLTYNRRGSNPENIFMIKHTNIIVCFLRVHHWQNAEFQQETTVSWIYQCGPSPPERIRISLLAHIMEKCYRNRKRALEAWDQKNVFSKKNKKRNTKYKNNQIQKENHLFPFDHVNVGLPPCSHLFHQQSCWLDWTNLDMKSKSWGFIFKDSRKENFRFNGKFS